MRVVENVEGAVGIENVEEKESVDASAVNG